MSTLQPPSSSIDLRAIEQAAADVWPGFHAQWLASIDSTNSELMRRAGAGNVAASLLVADAQTAGRGRMGKQWHTAPASAMAFSIGLPLAPLSWSGLSLVVGIAVASAISQWAREHGGTPQAGAQLGLKWPNDLWVMDAQGQGRKMAGILIETTAPAPAAGAAQAAPRGPHAPTPRHAVIGIGLNLAPSALATPIAPIGIAEWARLDASQPIDRSALLQTIVPLLLAQLRQFEQQGFGGFTDAFTAWDLLHGRTVSLSDGRLGVCLGVDAEGELLLAQGEHVITVTSGEVSVRPLPPAHRPTDTPAR